jgi:hypothetical protein
MFEFTDHQMVSCATTNLQILDKIAETLEDDLYALDVEYNDTTVEMVKLLQSLRTATLKHKYDAEIKILIELRKKL